MDAELDLSPQQWQTLRALRGGAMVQRTLRASALDELVALGLAAVDANKPHITPMGRTILIRGSARLWEDVAA